MLWEEKFVLGVISTNIWNDPFLFHFLDNLSKIESKEFKLADKNLSLSFVHILEVLYKINPIIGYEVWRVSNIIKHYQALKMINSEKIIIRKEISTSDYSKKFWNSVTHCAVIIPNMDKKDLTLRISKPITMWVSRQKIVSTVYFSPNVWQTFRFIGSLICSSLRFRNTQFLILDRFSPFYVKISED